MFLASPNHIPSRYTKIVVLKCYLFQIDSEQQKQTRKYGQMEKRNANDGEKSFTSREVVILRPSSSFPRLHRHNNRKRRKWRLPKDSPHQPPSSGIQAPSLQILWIVRGWFLSFTMLFSHFHVGSHWHKFLIQSHFPPSVSSKEDVQRRARLLARQRQKMTRSKNSHVLSCNNRVRVLFAYQSR